MGSWLQKMVEDEAYPAAHSIMMMNPMSRCSLDGDKTDDKDRADVEDEANGGTKPMVKSKTEPMVETKPLEAKPMKTGPIETRRMMETKSLCSAADLVVEATPLSKFSLKDGDKDNYEGEAYVPLLT